MKLSIFAKKRAWHVNQLVYAARKRKIEVDVIRLKSLAQYDELPKIIGNIIIWRSSFLNSADEKIVQTSLSHKPIINSSHIKWAFLSKKIFQQKHLSKFRTINCIPTYSFKNAVELKKFIGKELSFPIIKKPNIGAQGEGIALLKSFSDIKKGPLNLEKFIFQPFIENDGDFRVLVLGGKVLGIIKRTAKNGGFLNNISRGGTAEHITDKGVVEPLSEIALRIASAFELSFCGVDIIFNKKDGKYYFLELNTLPQWRGFQTATKISVADEIIEFCLLMAKRSALKTSSLVKEYFENNYSFLGKEQFHYFSRMFLWTKNIFYRKGLNRLEKNYIGSDESELNIILKKGLKHEKIDKNTLISYDIRASFYKKYPKIAAYNKVLFKSVFAETLYNKNIRPSIKKHVKENDFLKLRLKLKKDRRAIATLSTSAVNFFYNLSHYLQNPRLANPKMFLNIARKSYTGKLSRCVDLKLYLLTHSIIGESKFYSRKITRHKKTYLQMIKLCEDIILKNYFSISLDNKFEFLVCAKMLNYKSVVEKTILGEADRSLSLVGNFLVSKLNDSRGILGQNLLDAEHRNALYIMANTKPKK